MRVALVMASLAITACYGDPVREFLPGHDAAIDAWLPDPDAPFDAPPIDAAEVPCTTLATDPAVVPSIPETGTPPTPTGGAIVDATYDLESVHAYGGGPAQTYYFALRFVGSQWEYAVRLPPATVDTVRSGSVAIDAPTTTFTLHTTCGPTSNDFSFVYSMNPDGTLDTFDTSPTATYVSHFEPR